MSGLVAVGLTNAASATLLALVAAAASRMVRRPALVHGLWLLVLLDLLTPPVLVVGVVPALDWTETVEQVPALPLQTVAFDLAEPVAPPPGLQAPSWRLLAGAAWAVGAAALLVLALVRGLRFERLLGRGAIAPAPILARAEALARVLGLRRSPVVRLVPARVSPLLWFRPGRMEIVFPAALVEQLEPAELDALLVHELAHVRRGDHWVRWLELAASALFFWHPVVWWARARMRSAEERSCDAWVTTVLPAHARDYAGGVVKALEFLSPLRGPVLPALASGVAQFRSMEERLAMILSRRIPPPATRAQRSALAAAGIGLLLLFPAAAHRSSADPDPETEEASAAEAPTEEVRSIQAELEQLAQRQMELSTRLRELQFRGEQDRLREEISRLDSEGRVDEARRIETRAALLERQAQLDRERVERSFAVEQRALALESLARKAEVEQMEQERARLAERGVVDEAAQLEQGLSAMKLELALAEQGRHMRIAMQEVGRSSRAAEVRAEIDRLKAEIQRLVELEAVTDGVRGGVDDGVREAVEELERSLEHSRRRARERGTVY